VGVELFGLIFTAGLAWASLINGVAHRLLKERALLQIPPRCVKCDDVLAWYDVIPVISHMIFGGTCRPCASPASFVYPAVEFFGACVFTALWYTRGCDYGQIWSFKLSLDLLFATALLITLRTDLEELFIFRLSSLYLVPVCLACSLAGLFEATFWESFLGAALGYLIPWCAGRLFFAMRGVEGIGVGDLEFLAMIGAFFGSSKMIDSMVIACVSGIVIGIIYAVIHRDRQVRIPFGPFLALGALIELFC